MGLGSWQRGTVLLRERLPKDVRRLQKSQDAYRERTW